MTENVTRIFARAGCPLLPGIEIVGNYGEYVVMRGKARTYLSFASKRNEVRAAYILLSRA
jgi:hypothetical protein